MARSSQPHQKVFSRSGQGCRRQTIGLRPARHHHMGAACAQNGIMRSEPGDLRAATGAAATAVRRSESAITNSAGQRCVSHSAIAAGRGDVMRSRPLVPGDPAAASLVPGRCQPAAWADRGRRKRGGRGRTGDLGPCRPGPTPAAPPRGSANVKIARGREPGGEPEPGDGRRVQPENAGRRETIRRRATGTNLGGQTGNRRKARQGNPEDVR
jgi:hypothetical protein